MRKLKIKQVHIPGVGAIVDSLYTTLPILGAVNFVGIMAVLYATIRDYLLYWFPWMQFWVFMCVICAFTAVAMLLIYLFVLPSIWTFRQKQMFSYESGVVDRLDGLSKELKEVKKILEVKK